MAKKILIGLLCLVVGFAIAIPVFGMLNKDDDKDGIKINTSFKTEYCMGDTLDVTGGILDYTKDGKTTQVVITSTMVSGFTSSTTGTRRVVITYDGFTCMVSYTIKDARCIEDNVAYYLSTYNGYLIFFDNLSKMTMGGTESGQEATDVSEIMYVKDGGWDLIEKKLVDGKYELTYGSEYERFKVVNITETGFTWQYVTKSTGAVEYEVSVTRFGVLPAEENVGIENDKIFLSDRNMPADTGDLANALLYVKFTSGNTKMLIGESVSGTLTFPSDRECDVTKAYKNGKLMYAISYRYIENEESIYFYVENITSNGFTIRIPDLDNFTLNMIRL